MILRSPKDNTTEPTLPLILENGTTTEVEDLLVSPYQNVLPYRVLYDKNHFVNSNYPAFERDITLK